MSPKNIQSLAKEYLNDPDNQEDYNAFAHDHDDVLLNKVAFSWAKAQDHDDATAKLLSTYIVELAYQNHPD